MREARWPHDARAAAAFSFDLDAETLWLGWGKHEPVALSQGRFGATEGTALVLEVLRQAGVPATFFIPGWVAEEHRPVVRSIVEAGHEIGAHGYLHESVKEMSREDEDGILARSVNALLAAGAGTPAGYRAPAWEVSGNTLELLAARGFRYSSNFMDRSVPYMHSSGVVELPVQWALDDAPFFLFPVVKPISPPSAALEVWRSEFDGITALGGLTVFTFHPQLIGRPGRLAALRELVRHVAETPGVWIARLDEIAAHWAGHAA